MPCDTLELFMIQMGTMSEEQMAQQNGVHVTVEVI